MFGQDLYPANGSQFLRHLNLYDIRDTNDGAGEHFTEDAELKKGPVSIKGRASMTLRSIASSPH